MNKTLLLSLAAIGAAAGICTAAEPVMELLPNFVTTNISNNGRYVGSSYNGMVTIKDIQTGATQEFGDGFSMYDFGNGKSIADNGIAIGSIDEQAVIYRNGEPVYFIPNVEMKDEDGNPVLDDENNPIEEPAFPMSYANAINPSGTRIVGDVTNLNNTLGWEGTQLVPVYWDVNADGTVDETKYLPYPELDFSGRRPIYVTAIAISDDGKTVAGQINDYSGRISYPILYTQLADGEWEYSLPAAELLNPNHLVLPEYPEEPGYAPEATDYMTDEERAAYDEAYDAWIASGYDQDLYPNPANYMTAEEIDAYNTDTDEYNAKAEVFNEALMKYSEIFDQMLADSPLFNFNNLVLSGDASMIATSAIINGESFYDPSFNYPITFDLTTNTYKKYSETYDTMPISIFNGGDMMCVTPPSWTRVDPLESYVVRNGSEEFTPVLAYFEGACPAYAELLKKNLTHLAEVPVEVEVTEKDDEGNEYTYTDYEFVEKDITFIGVMQCNPSMTTFAGYAEAYLWIDYEPADEEDMQPDYMGYVMSGAEVNAVKGIQMADVNIGVRAMRGGILMVDGAESVAIYDLSGRKMVAVANTGNVIRTGLTSGAYIVKATAGNAHKTFKVVF